MVLRRVARWTMRSLRQAAVRHSDRIYPLLRLCYRSIPMPRQRKERMALRLFQAIPALSPVSAERIRPARGHSPNTQRRRILVAADGIPTPDINASSLRLMHLLQLIADEGWEITFLSAESRRSFILPTLDAKWPPYLRSLSAMGVHVLFGRNDAVVHLAEEGGSYRAAILSTPEVMYAFAPILRAYMPLACLIYDISDLRWLGLARQAALQGDEATSRQAILSWKMDSVNLVAADRITVSTEADERRILDQSPSLKITVLPNTELTSTVRAGAIALRVRELLALAETSAAEA